MKKYIIICSLFLTSFFLCGRVFASEFVRLSLEDSYIQFFSNNSALNFHLGSQNTTNKPNLVNTYTYTQNGSGPVIDSIYLELNNSGGFLAHKEYQFSLVLDSNNNANPPYSELFPYLVYLPNDYSLDTNLLFNSKNVKFCQDSGCSSYFSREQMNLSYFSMGYSDDTTYNIYTLNFTFVSPYPVDHLEFNLITNTNLVNSNNYKVWTLKSGNAIKLDFRRSMLAYDYYDFQGVPNDNVCVGDECINDYEPDDSITSNPNINTNINISTILANAWGGVSSFASASFYVLSLINDFFLTLPGEIRALLVFCFALSVIVIIWKIFKI